MCQLQNIPLINIVRQENQLEELKKLGATYVLNSSKSGFESELKDLARQRKATLFLDAISGRQTSLLLRTAPAGSKVVVYARLSGEDIQADPAELVIEGKSIEGFQLGNWLQKQNILFKLSFLSKVKRHLEKELSSNIRRTYPLAEVDEALAEYQKNMSDGKILLKA